MLEEWQTIQVDGYPGVAFWIRGIEGHVVYAVMVGDDRVHRFHADECTPIGEDEFCQGCGQLGCGHG